LWRLHNIQVRNLKYMFSLKKTALKHVTYTLQNHFRYAVIQISVL
jgi:hypothetical protein